MELEELDGYIRENWNSIREQIRNRSYKPQPVRRVEIPKPNGSKRKLGIPTVMDRVIQQGIAQVISPMCEPLFSENSYGFRPNRGCEMAVREMLMFLNEGYEWIVDIDLEKIFRQRTAGQTDEPCAQHHKRWGYGITDTEISESGGNGTGKV